MLILLYSLLLILIMLVILVVLMFSGVIFREVISRNLIPIPILIIYIMVIISKVIYIYHINNSNNKILNSFSTPQAPTTNIAISSISTNTAISAKSATIINQAE